MTVYAMGSTNDDLIEELHDADPKKRADAARTLGEVRDYLALPHLIGVARSDREEWVRAAARHAVRQLMPSKQAADRAIDAHPDDSSDPQRLSRAREVAAARAIRAFNAYVAAKRDRTMTSGQAASAAVEEAVAYLSEWGGDSADDLDEVGLAAVQAIGAIARHLEIPPQQASAKWLSYKDAQARVAAHGELFVRREIGLTDPEVNPYLWRRS